ncbi:sulfotransferase 2B1-like isoform X2 [Aquarana catesbeiana]|uniref:sulfotransferase 2B1-like isoform X2 n=1 Tax=Aquarana catesbeiana TaxID=8400 RepID=UPI003CC9265C
MSVQYFTYKGVNFSPGSYSHESLNFAENEFQVQDDDVYIVTYPKSGTNWMIEILSLLRTNGDPTWCNSVPIWRRSPWFETLKGQSQIIDVTPPRVLSSHLPFHIFAKSFFTSKAKIIYVLRNPKDILVSLFYFCKMIRIFKDPESFEEFFEDFLQGNDPECQDQFAMVWDGRQYTFTVLPEDYVHSPTICYGLIARDLSTLSLKVAVFHYIDDIMISGAKKDVTEALHLLIHHMENRGWAIDKVQGPATEVKFLEMMWTGPQRKIQETVVQRLCRPLLPRKRHRSSLELWGSGDRSSHILD